MSTNNPGPSSANTIAQNAYYQEQLAIPHNERFKRVASKTSNLRKVTVPVSGSTPQVVNFENTRANTLDNESYMPRYGGAGGMYLILGAYILVQPDNQEEDASSHTYPEYMKLSLNWFEKQTGTHDISNFKREKRSVFVQIFTQYLNQVNTAFVQRNIPASVPSLESMLSHQPQFGSVYHAAFLDVAKLIDQWMTMVFDKAAAKGRRRNEDVWQLLFSILCVLGEVIRPFLLDVQQDKPQIGREGTPSGMIVASSSNQAQCAGGEGTGGIEDMPHSADGEKYQAGESPWNGVDFSVGPDDKPLTPLETLPYSPSDEQYQGGGSPWNGVDFSVGPDDPPLTPLENFPWTLDDILNDTVPETPK